MNTSAENDLMFGLIALQVGLIDQSKLVAAFQAWTLDRSRPLAAHLIVRGDIDGDDRAAILALVARHLRKHGGNVEESLAAIPAGASTREVLASIGDPGIGASLARVGSGPEMSDDDERDRTASYGVGTTTSGGQRFRVLRPHARGGLGECSSRSTPSCTARWPSSRFSNHMLTTQPAGSGSFWKRRLPVVWSTLESFRFTAWEPTAMAAPTTRCDSSRETASRRPSTRST